MLTVGSKAPAFNLRNQEAKFVDLASMSGKKVLLSFRPLAWTPI
jgi:peroxiredoxin